MKVLAVDSAGPGASVALRLADGISVVRDAGVPRAHAGDVLALVDDVLAEADLKLPDIDRFAFGAGPGGLTGVRVAASVVQGFAWAVERPVVAVSNLRAAAWLLRDAAESGSALGVVLVHDAGMGQCIVGRFDAGAAPLADEVMLDPAQFALPEGRWALSGSGIDLLTSVAGAERVALPATLSPGIAALAADPDAATLSPAMAQPVYWRHPVNG